jgi:hypothetical protein
MIYLVSFLILGFLPLALMGQGIQVSGKVAGPDGIPLPGVSVIVKGTTVGTVSDVDGNFRLTLPQNAQTLVFSFVGMKVQEVPVAGKVLFNVQLMEEAVGVDEVVIVGYGVQKKANLTGAVDQVSSEAFENRSIANINQGLKGVMPNLNITLGDGKPNQAPSFNIRVVVLSS